MIGFGNLNNIEAFKKFVNVTGESPLVESQLTPQEESKLNNVCVPIMDNSYCPSPKLEEKEEKEIEKSVGASGNEAKLPDKNKPIGGAGNAEEKDEEAIMGCMGMGGIGGGIKKEMARMEGFSPNDVVDEEPMEVATDSFKANSIDKVKDTFNHAFDNTYKKAKDKNFDYDFSYIKPTVSQVPLGNIPKGW